jgi:transcriptional regulator with XRE-family HTH domain
VLNQIRERQGRPIKEIAAAAHIGYNTLWEYTQQDHHNTAHTPYAFAQALGYTPERIAQITARWLTKYIHRRQRLLGKGPDYRPKFPWEQKPRQTDPD